MEKRIQKIISECGIASRRNAEELIEQGKVKVNGQIAKIGQKADLDKDEIFVKGIKLRNIEKIYLALNKPVGFVTSTKDPHEKTIMEVIPDKYRKAGVYPVGRLDKYTEGLIFLTNDGDFANNLMHPRYKVEKRYEGICSGTVSKDEMKKLQTGIKLEEGLAKGRVFLKSSGENTYFAIKIYTGWNRQVRRMFEAIGHTVLKLRRTDIGTYSIESLGKRQTKELSKGEVEDILNSVKISKKPETAPGNTEEQEDDEEPVSKRPEKKRWSKEDRVYREWPKKEEEKRYRLDWMEKDRFESKRKVIPFDASGNRPKRSGKLFSKEDVRSDDRKWSGRNVGFNRNSSNSRNGYNRTGGNFRSSGSANDRDGWKGKKPGPRKFDSRQKDRNDDGDGRQRRTVSNRTGEYRNRKSRDGERSEESGKRRFGNRSKARRY